MLYSLPCLITSVTFLGKEISFMINFSSLTGMNLVLQVILFCTVNIVHVYVSCTSLHKLSCVSNIMCNSLVCIIFVSHILSMCLSGIDYFPVLVDILIQYLWCFDC